MYRKYSKNRESDKIFYCFWQLRRPSLHSGEETEGSEGMREVPGLSRA